ncbi:MAG: sulfatase-like hydrolase/transferase, partial [Planctomycetota bacterium]
QVKAGRTIMLNDRVVASQKKPLPDGWYSTDAWTEYGLKFIDEAVAAQQPFLLYLAHNAPHVPLQATAADIAKHRGKYRQGWDVIAQRRWQKQVELGIVDAAWRPAERPEGVADWNDLTADQRDRFDHLMAAYAACVDRMDQSIGKLVAGLESRQILDNTLILFMSDNGGSAEGGPAGKTVGDPTTAKSNWFCGKSWAWVEDVPFRKFKKYSHEGGVATPLIAHWPAGIAERGGLRTAPAHVIDVMSTIVDVTGGVYPKERNGATITPTAGVSLRPLFAEEAPLQREALFWEHEGNAAIRHGDWKLVREGARGAWELYDLTIDRTESRNVAAEHPDRIADLAARWHDWAERCRVSPHGAPKRRKAESTP